jgi:adenylate cyclase
MGVEIERKFLLRDSRWRELVEQTIEMQQAYLGGDRCSIRVRLEGTQARLNIKSREAGIRRLEYELLLDPDTARELMREFGGQAVQKRRHIVRVGQTRFEIDEFLGDNAPLVVAEVELADEDAAFERPDWLGVEVSGDTRYFNTWLAAHPYSTWSATC